MRWILNRLTYANVMATFAVFLGLTGTAYAAVAVANNSVGSPQIINGSIKSVDIGNGQVTGADVAEGTLAKVPAAVNADKLGGFSAGAYHRTAARFTGTFDGIKYVTVPNYGDYGLTCDAAGVHFYWNPGALGAGNRSIVDMSFSASAYGTTGTRVLSFVNAGAGSSVTGDRSFHASALAANAAGTHKIAIEAFGSGFDDANPDTTGDCWGSIEAVVLK